MRQIKIRIDTSITEAELRDPRFLRLWLDAERALNARRTGAGSLPYSPV